MTIAAIDSSYEKCGLYNQDYDSNYYGNYNNGYYNNSYYNNGYYNSFNTEAYANMLLYGPPVEEVDPDELYDEMGQNISRTAECSAYGADVGQNLLGVAGGIVGSVIGTVVGSIWDIFD